MLRSGGAHAVPTTSPHPLRSGSPRLQRCTSGVNRPGTCSKMSRSAAFVAALLLGLSLCAAQDKCVRQIWVH